MVSCACRFGDAVDTTAFVAIEADRYPMSRRIRVLKDILMKFGEMGGLSPEMAQRLRRYTSPPPAPRPQPRVYEPPNRGRYKRR